MTDYALAARVIARFEGYIPTAKWDVNHYRLGFGSDTEGPEQRNVVRGMTTTRERALANLALRVPAFERAIINQVGATAWNALTDLSRGALLSFAYNYGDLTPTLARCVTSGDHQGTIAAIDARAIDNGQINAKRRFAEASIFAVGVTG